MLIMLWSFFFFSSRRRHTRFDCDWSSDVCSSDLDRLLKKWATAKKLVPRAVIDATAGAPVGLVSLGSCDGAVREAIEVLKSRGVGVDYMRVRSFPFSEDVERFQIGRDHVGTPVTVKYR